MKVFGLALALASAVAGAPADSGETPEKQIEKFEQTCKQERIKARRALLEARDNLAKVQSEHAKANGRIVEISEIMNILEIGPDSVKKVADLATELEPLKAAQQKREKDLLSLRAAALEAEEEERTLEFIHKAKRALLWRKLGISSEHP